jgi:hypothetical protein
MEREIGTGQLVTVGGGEATVYRIQMGGWSCEQLLLFQFWLFPRAFFPQRGLSKRMIVSYVGNISWRV